MASVTPVSMSHDLAAILCRHMYPKGNQVVIHFVSVHPGLSGKNSILSSRAFDRVLGLEFFHKLNRIVVCDNLFFMRAKILRQNMQQGVLGLLKVNVELLLLFLVEIIKIKKSVPAQTPPISRRVQSLGGLIG
jgi:hypothetical protein